MKKLLTTIVLVLIAGNALAVQPPRDGRVDPRIKQAEYREGQVYRIHAHYLQDSLIMFSEDEKIIHIGTGDPIAWSLTPVNNYLSIKPIEKKADTNLNVLTKNLVTGKVRPYVFELNASNSNSIKNRSGTFMMKFNYPEDALRERMITLSKIKMREKPKQLESKQGTDAKDWNLNYSYSGSDLLVPIRTFDDGKFTYFEFPKKIDTPAIFLVDSEKNESLINYHVSGNYIVVQRTGKQFILRDGKIATCIYNDSYNPRPEGTKLTHNAKQAVLEDADSIED